MAKCPLQCTRGRIPKLNSAIRKIGGRDELTIWRKRNPRDVPFIIWMLPQRLFQGACHGIPKLNTAIVSHVC